MVASNGVRPSSFHRESRVRNGSERAALNSLSVRLVLSAALLLALAGTASAATAPPAMVPFKTYGSPYFVRNDFQPGVPRSYAVIRTWKAFQAAFGVGVTMNGPKPTIAPATFRSKMLLVAIERGPLCSFISAKVARDVGGLRVEYGLRCPAANGATFAVPLILAVGRADAAVSFVENGRTVSVVAPTP
jgi:hypothetical protein